MGALIVVCGESLIDMTRSGEGFVPRPGGSPYNVSIGLGRLGTPAGFLGRISTDGFGERLWERLQENGVDGALCARGPELTMLAFVQPLPGGGETYSFYAERSADRMLSVADLPPSLPGVEALHFGSFSLGLEPGATALRTLLEREAGRRLITLDPNIRPSLLPDRNTYRDLLEHLLPHVDLVKVSDVDAEWVYPGRDIREIVAHWQELGAALVVITRGPGGSWATTGRVTAEAPVHPVSVVDTIGAGDSFMSGLLAWLHREGRVSRAALESMDAGALQAALHWSAVVSALTCTRAGAEPPTLEEVEEVEEVEHARRAPA